jgi:hypothetical protein
MELPFPDGMEESASSAKPRRELGSADNLTTEPGRAEQPDGQGPPEGRHRSYWTEAPHFQRAWADHERNWPKSEQPAATVDRSQDPPGSWRSDSNLLLAPEDNTRAKGAIDRVHAAEPQVTADLEHVAQQSPFGGELVGLEFRCKGEDRLKEKVAEKLKIEPDRLPESAVRGMHDAIRYTVRLDQDNYVAGYQDIKLRLEDSGYEMYHCKNQWDDPEYKGINTRWMTPGDQRFEVQFHTAESYHAKQEVTHGAYERIRNRMTTDDERAQLRAFQREVSSWIPVPEGATGISSPRRENP